MFSAAKQLEIVDLYDRLAPDYDRLHRRWLRYAGGEAQAALEAAVRALLTSNTNLLDAGCGTGAFARKLISEGMSPECITLLDPSEAMLAQCNDLPVPKVTGRLEALPFADGEFEVVTCAWALETVPSPEQAISELCRVVRRGGTLCVAFCADTPALTLTTWLMRQALLRRNTGSFLNKRLMVETIRTRFGFQVRMLPCGGPTAALIARRL